MADAARFEDSNPVRLVTNSTSSAASGTFADDERPLRPPPDEAVPAFAGRGWLGRVERMLAPTNAPGD